MTPDPSQGCVHCGSKAAYTYDRETGARVCLDCEIAQLDAIHAAWEAGRGN